MKMSRIIHLCLAVIITLIISSCGDDNTAPTNPSTPSGTVLYSKDSIALWVQSGTSIKFDSSSFTTSETGGNGVKVEFRIQSNVDSSQHSTGYYRLYSNATPLIVMLSDIYFPIDQQYTSNFNFATGSTYFSFVVKLMTTGTTTPFYVRLKDIKVTKL